ncbi:MAG: hypothetical protein D6820_17335, partial [Lentisphaerae bacterium]
MMMNKTVFVFAGFMAFCSTMIAESTRDWVYLSKILPQSGNYTIPLRWDVERGARLIFHRLRHDSVKRDLLLNLDPRRPTLLWVGKEGQEPQHVSPKLTIMAQNFPKKTGLIQFNLIVRPAHWWLYYGEKPLLRIPRLHPLPVALGVSQANVEPNNKLVKFKKIARFTQHSAFMDEALVDKDKDPLEGWKKYGDALWHIHSVRDDAFEQKTSTRLNKMPPDAQHSPNFYTLWGGGKPGVLVTGLPEQNDYEVSASIQTGSAEGGVVALYRPEWGGYVLAVEPIRPNDTTAELHLFRLDPQHRRKLLARAQIPTHFGQWLQLKLRVFGDSLEGLVDHASIFKVRTQLVPGGMYGFFAHDPFAKLQKEKN